MSFTIRGTTVTFLKTRTWVFLIQTLLQKSFNKLERFRGVGVDNLPLLSKIESPNTLSLLYCVQFFFTKDISVIINRKIQVDFRVEGLKTWFSDGF